MSDSIDEGQPDQQQQDDEQVEPKIILKQEQIAEGLS